MMEEAEFLQVISLDGATLKLWLEESWIVPSEMGGARVFDEMDLARARLILDLQRDMGVNDPGVGVILHLVDQIHGLRRALAGLVSRAQPDRADHGEKAGGPPED